MSVLGVPPKVVAERAIPEVLSHFAITSFRYVEEDLRSPSSPSSKN